MHDQDNKNRFLKRYLPNPALSSPHRYQQQDDYFEQLSAEAPNPSFDPSNTNYELTFKKQQQNPFVKDYRYQNSRSLFQQSQSRLLSTIREPIQNYFRKSIEQLINLPYADLLSLELDEMSKLKINIIGQILEVKRIRSKISSVDVNLRCLRLKETVSHQQKNKLFLLDLLWKQLTKKLFVEALKLNHLETKYKLEYREVEELNQQTLFQAKQGHNYGNITEEEIDQLEYNQTVNQSGRQVWNLQQQVEVNEENQQKLFIFHHSMSHIIKRLIFYSFRKIQNQAQANRSKLQRKLTDLKQARAELYQNKMILIPSDRQVSKQIQSQHQQVDQQEEEQENQANSNISLSKVQQLKQFIQNLHWQCSQTDNLLRKYFIKMKIHLLQSIAESLLNQINYKTNVQEEQRQNDGDEHQNQDEIQHQLSKTYQHLHPESDLSRLSGSRLTTQSQMENSLKLQKRQLKQFIRLRQINRFFNLLKDNYELKKIASICIEMRQQYIIRKAFQSLKMNVQSEKGNKHMQAYYENISEEQYEDDGTSTLFNKTNLLYKYFHKFKTFLRDSKMVRMLEKIQLKISFKTIIFFCYKQKKYNEVIQRRREYQSSKLMFKYFCAWKQFYLKQNSYNDRYKMYMTKKQKEQLKYYFSLLKLQIKKTKLRQIKVANYYKNKLKNKIFIQMKYLYLENRQFKEKESQLQNVLIYSRAKLFMHSFKLYYRDYLQFQRFSMKQEKLKRTLIKLHALQSIKMWRTNHIKKNTYQVIEMKLTKLKDKQKKRQIFTFWYDKMLNIHYQSSPSNHSEQHKDWLVKYYGDLCTVIPQ